jgi:hypothetical protein
VTTIWQGKSNVNGLYVFSCLVFRKQDGQVIFVKWTFSNNFNFSGSFYFCAMTPSAFFKVALPKFFANLYQLSNSNLRLCTVRDTEFRASFFCHFKKLRCKSLFIVNVTFKSQILKSIFCSRQSHVNQNRRKR